ncbi:MAG TPA: hypothetical protein DCO79_01970 [Spirochaeta sp.]|nr:hypothetical protein [Spirochaeta sp.]
MHTINLMVVDNEELLLQSLVDLLESRGYAVEAFLSAQDALNVLRAGKKKFNIILTDINMPVMDGYRFIEEIKKTLFNEIKIIVLTGYGSIDSAVKAVKLGADSYCQKDQDPELLLSQIRNMAAQIEMKQELDSLHKEAGNNLLYLFDSSDSETRRVYDTAKQIASKDVNILITGESGTGKEILSRFIYNGSGVTGRFVSVNCSAIPDSLFESTMFGHVKGAFTGAHENSSGFFKQAEGGVLLLDEIGELIPMNQAKLLKVIEERFYFSVGSSLQQEADCRLIAATNKDLPKMIEEGSFRTDFYYRLNTVTLNLPPLRQRKGDILEFAKIFIKQFSRKYQHDICGINPAGEKVLLSYNWPGNIRQLRQTIERCVLFASGDQIDAELLNENISENCGELSFCINGDVSCPYREVKTLFEKEYFSNLINSVNFNINEAAALSGMNRTYIYQKIKELGIEKKYR